MLNMMIHAISEISCRDSSQTLTAYFVFCSLLFTQSFRLLENMLSNSNYLWVNFHAVVTAVVCHVIIYQAGGVFRIRGHQRAHRNTVVVVVVWTGGGGWLGWKGWWCRVGVLLDRKVNRRSCEWNRDVGLYKVVSTSGWSISNTTFISIWKRFLHVFAFH